MVLKMNFLLLMVCLLTGMIAFGGWEKYVLEYSRLIFFLSGGGLLISLTGGYYWFRRKAKHKDVERSEQELEQTY